jgi:S1-C subfamily serine protease
MKTIWAFFVFLVSVVLLFLAVTADIGSRPATPIVPVREQSQTNSTTTQNQTATSTTSLKETTKTTIKKIPTVVSATTTTTIKTVPQTPIDLVTINSQTRMALVNILCDTKFGGPLSPISGSGVIVSSDGVILTNAHIAQFFLLKDLDGKNSVQCVIRTGSPAYATYNAELLYISPIWVSQNKSILLEAEPKGSGEHDYAFLRITGRIDDSAMPASIPFLPISLSEADPTGQFALLAAYPAGFLGGQSIVQDLFQSSAETTIQKVFTFSKNTSDVLSVPGTIISQKGSSGGAVVNSVGQLMGIITTDTDAIQTSARDLNAISTTYINRDLKAESGSGIADILSFPIAYAQNFNATIAPKLTEILTNALLQK